MEEVLLNVTKNDMNAICAERIFQSTDFVLIHSETSKYLIHLPCITKFAAELVFCQAVGPTLLANMY